MRIIPEFDQPAHVAAGWDFKESEDLTVCKDKQPWYDYCNEPPCGQVGVNERILSDVWPKRILHSVFNINLMPK